MALASILVPSLDVGKAPANYSLGTVFDILTTILSTGLAYSTALACVWCCSASLGLPAVGLLFPWLLTLILMCAVCSQLPPVWTSGGYGLALFYGSPHGFILCSSSYLNFG